MNPKLDDKIEKTNEIVFNNKEKIVRHEERINTVEKNIGDINKTLSNHVHDLTNMIFKLDSKNDSDHAKIYDKIDNNGKENRELMNKIIWYIAIGLVATTAITILTQIFFKSLN